MKTVMHIQCLFDPDEYDYVCYGHDSTWDEKDMENWYVLTYEIDVPEPWSAP